VAQPPGKEIFFFLLCSTTAQTREAITTAIWPDLSPARAPATSILTFTASAGLFTRASWSSSKADYRINPSLNIWFDIAAFEQAAGRVHDSLGDAGALISSLEQAVDIYRGPFLSNIYSEWAEEKRKTLEEPILKV